MTQPERHDLGPQRLPLDRSKADLHIPGAGTMGMFVLVLSLSMLFAASMVLYFVLRSRVPEPQWRPYGFTGLPATLWLSTALLLSCSGTIHWALLAVRKDRQQSLLIGLTVTLALGVLFLAVQSYNWYELWQEIAASQHRSKFMATFYMLTGLHAAHVLGGLIPLTVVLIKAAGHKYSRNFYPGVRYCTIYWHFLDVAWLVIFVSLVAGT